jgi:hypothetical protein
MLTSDLLQRNHPSVMIGPELPKAYRQRQFICAVTFHFLLSAREGRSLLHWAHSHFLPVTRHRALGAPVTRHCVPRTPIRAELPEAYSQRQFICSFTSHS